MMREEIAMNHFVLAGLWTTLIVVACSSSPTESIDDIDAGGQMVEGGIGLNDVSILIPVDHDPAAPTMLRFATETQQGKILSISLFEAAPLMEAFESSATEYYENWVIVAARIDPCFPSLSLIDLDPRRLVPNGCFFGRAECLMKNRCFSLLG